MTLINVGTGVDFGYDPSALSQFSSTAAVVPPGDVDPQLAMPTRSRSVVDASDRQRRRVHHALGLRTDVDAGVRRPDARQRLQRVRARHGHGVEDGLDRDDADEAYYYIAAVSDKELKVAKLFQRNFKSTGACDDVSIVRYDREERTVKTPGSFSPPPPTIKDSICWEANVITFNSSNVFGSKNVANLDDDLRERLGVVQLPAGRVERRPDPVQRCRAPARRQADDPGRPDQRDRRRSSRPPRTSACRSSASRRGRSATGTWVACCRTTAATTSTSTRAVVQPAPPLSN